MAAHMTAWRRTLAIATAAAMAGALAVPTGASAQALRLGAPSVPSAVGAANGLPTGEAGTEVQQVQYRQGPPPGWRGGGPNRGWRGAGWRGPGYYNRGWGGPGWRGPGYYGPRSYNYGYNNNNGGAVAAGVIGGLALGAIAAGAANANQNQNQGNAVAYCAQRFKSYDARSGTYLGYDGLRHSCP